MIDDETCSRARQDRALAELRKRTAKNFKKGAHGGNMVSPVLDTEASSYTERDTPIFVGQLMDVRACLDALDGASARVEA